MPRHPHFPLLTMIDAARDPGSHPFATDPEAAGLERRARELAEEFWPEQLWLTGSISPALLAAVTRRLELARVALHEGIRIYVATRESTTPHA